MRISRDCWKCEFPDCGHVWIAAGEEPPDQCAKCRRRKWHTPDLVVAESQPRVQYGPRKKRILKTDAVATTGAKVTIAQEVAATTVEPFKDKPATERRDNDPCPHGFNTRKFCVTMNLEKLCQR